jgi:hypothetical protein
MRKASLIYTLAVQVFSISVQAQRDQRDQTPLKNRQVNSVQKNCFPAYE